MMIIDDNKRQRSRNLRRSEEVGQLKRVRQSARRLYDMREVVYDVEWLSKTKNLDLYYMYREASLDKDDIKIKNQNLRYDITLIPPRMLGCEYVKTQGHYHPKIPGQDISYPEIYEVLRGEGYFLMQKGVNDIEDVILVKAEMNDKVIIPPDYGHVTINASGGYLETANWIANFESNYDPIKKKSGMAYFLLEKGIVKNNNYDNVPEIRRILPIEIPEIGIKKNKKLYDLVENIEMLEFLLEPQKYTWLFDKFKV